MNLIPSRKIAVGANRIKEMMVIIEKRLMLSNDPCQEHNAGYDQTHRNDIKQELNYFDVITEIILVTVIWFLSAISIAVAYELMKNWRNFKSKSSVSITSLLTINFLLSTFRD